MYNRKELNEACDYLIENYKGMMSILDVRFEDKKNLNQEYHRIQEVANMMNQ